ncbi:MAG: TetR/AcrR family transcriptional regulator [Lachnospiraceae bacterium]|nr:TetR/AcrR family transcriptional regulator [Lachnospiraceae bacterium]
MEVIVVPPDAGPGAGVTNGAFYAHFASKEDLFSKLADPCLAQFAATYNEEAAHFHEIHSTEDITRILSASFSPTEMLVHFLFTHKEVFLLLLTASSGSKYADFPAPLIEAEATETLAFLEKCRPFIRKPERLTASIVHLGTMLSINAVPDSFKAGCSEKETLEVARISSEFCIAGMKEVFGI